MVLSPTFHQPMLPDGNGMTQEEIGRHGIFSVNATDLKFAFDEIPQHMPNSITDPRSQTLKDLELAPYLLQGSVIPKGCTTHPIYKYPLGCAGLVPLHATTG